MRIFAFFHNVAILSLGGRPILLSHLWLQTEYNWTSLSPITITNKI